MRVECWRSAGETLLEGLKREKEREKRVEGQGQGQSAPALAFPPFFVFLSLHFSSDVFFFSLIRNKETRPLWEIFML